MDIAQAQKPEMAPSHHYLRNDSKEAPLLRQSSILRPWTMPVFQTEGSFSNLLSYTMSPMESFFTGPPHTMSGLHRPQIPPEYYISTKTSTATATTGEECTYQQENPSSSLPQAGAMAPRHEDASVKRAIKLFKNREAARQCRRKKKEYVKCLEDHVDLLEKQNKKLIEELRALKDVYQHGAV